MYVVSDHLSLVLTFIPFIRNMSTIVKKNCLLEQYCTVSLLLNVVVLPIGGAS